MAIKTINDEILTNIADAIREKGGTSETLYPHEMADAILDLEAGEVADLTELTVTPSDVAQTINPVSPHNGFSKVIVQAIPSNYGHIAWNGSTLKVY